MIYANPAALRLARSDRQPAGTRFDAFLHFDDAGTSECRVSQALASGERRNAETRVRGETPVHYFVEPIRDGAGQLTGAIVTVEDISERKAVAAEIVRLAEGLAAGDLTSRATGQYEGDFLAIVQNLNRGLGAQHDAILQVATSVEQMNAAASQIAAGSERVATGATQQAAALDDTQENLRKLGGLVRQTTEDTGVARGATASARSSAADGGAAIERLVDAMSRIRTAASSSAEIIRDINDIALQTNLLALNAAVEAARAGDAGQGFAVVAEEVRSLALRSKEAARKTDQLLGESLDLAVEGEKISRATRGDLNGIVAAVGQVDELVQRIDEASKQQERSLEGVRAAIEQMDDVVRANAAAAEESSSAAEEMASQAKELADMTGRIRLDRRRARAA